MMTTDRNPASRPSRNADILRKLRKLFSPQDKRKFLLISFLMAISGMMEMAGVGLLVGAVALFLKPESEAAGRIFSAFRILFPAATELTFLLMATTLIAAILILKNLFALGIVHLQSHFIRAKQSELASRLFCAYLASDYLYFSGRSADECSGNIERVQRMCDNFLLPGMQLIADLLVIFFLAVTAVILLPKITVGGVLFMLLCGAAIHFGTRKLNRRIGAERQDFELKENKVRLETLLGMEQIRASGCEKFFARHFHREYDEMSKRTGKLYTLGQLPRLGLESAALLLVLLIFFSLLLTGVEREGILLIFTVIVATLARILPALSRAHYNLTLIRQYSVQFELIADELFRIPPAPAGASAVAADASRDIEIRELCFRYQPEKPVFSGLTLTIPAGRSIGIAGRSGRGKSTLIHLLLGLLHPDSGSITAGGIGISAAPEAWRAQIGYVPQNVFLFDGTLRENVAFGEEPDAIDDEKVRRALHLAELDDFLPRLTDLISANGGNLSGGQKQRIGIARALYRSPKLLLLDEATSALDAQTENGFCDTLRHLHGQMTIVVISHRPTTLDCCDQVVEL